jgi:hypothetical protein
MPGPFLNIAERLHAEFADMASALVVIATIEQCRVELDSRSVQALTRPPADWG